MDAQMCWMCLLIDVLEVFISVSCMFNWCQNKTVKATSLSQVRDFFLMASLMLNTGNTNLDFFKYILGRFNKKNITKMMEFSIRGGGYTFSIIFDWRRKKHLFPKNIQKMPQFHPETWIINFRGGAQVLWML